MNYDKIIKRKVGIWRKTMYKLPEDDLKLLNKLLLMKDLNPEDGYSKEKVIEYILTQIESWKRQNLTRYVIMY